MSAAESTPSLPTWPARSSRGRLGADGGNRRAMGAVGGRSTRRRETLPRGRGCCCYHCQVQVDEPWYRQVANAVIAAHILEVEVIEQFIVLNTFIPGIDAASIHRTTPARAPMQPLTCPHLCFHCRDGNTYRSARLSYCRFTGACGGIPARWVEPDGF